MNQTQKPCFLQGEMGFSLIHQGFSLWLDNSHDVVYIASKMAWLITFTFRKQPLVLDLDENHNIWNLAP